MGGILLSVEMTTDIIPEPTGCWMHLGAPLIIIYAGAYVEINGHHMWSRVWREPSGHLYLITLVFGAMAELQFRVPL